MRTAKVSPKWQVIQGDVLDVLKTLDAESFDFVLSDVPYGLGGHEPTPVELLAFFQGARGLRTGDFMGTKWEIPTPEIWAEVKRVAKPGAHCFSFAGTRTWDLVSMGLRMAGWTNRDTIAMDHPALRMVSAQGMSKGARVGKAIDRAKGAKREVVGMVTRPDGTQRPNKANWTPGTASKYAQDAWTQANMAQGGNDITAPATPEAAEWEGFGSCLAPTWEPVLVFRKPLDGTLAENVLAHGCGALNVDECRTYTDWSDRPDSWKRSGHSAKPDAEKLAAPPGIGIECHPSGRWPKNAALVHAAQCGTECIDGCPIKLLDEQAGVRTSGFMKAGTKREGIGYGGGCGCEVRNDTIGDTGAASRFFPTFRQDPPEPFRFAPKASRQEREIGCHGIPGEGSICNTGKCVKPQAFLRWLVRLGCRPGGRVLVPYCGSGSEMIACVCAGMDVVGIENDPEMIPIANARIKWWLEHPELSEEAKAQAAVEARGQGRLFG